CPQFQSLAADPSIVAGFWRCAIDSICRNPLARVIRLRRPNVTPAPSARSLRTKAVVSSDRFPQEKSATTSPRAAGAYHRPFIEFNSIASACPSHTPTKQSTSESTELATTLSHWPSSARLKVCRLKEEKVV